MPPNRACPQRELMVVDERLEDAAQRSLLASRESGQRKRTGGHARQQLRTQSRTCWRELNDLHPAVVGRRPALDETVSLQPVDQSRNVRGVTVERLRQAAHRQRSLRLDQVQDVALHRREVEPRARRRKMLPLREEELHEQLPGATGIRVGPTHRGHYT